MYLNEHHAHRDHAQGSQGAQTNEKQLDTQPSKPTRRFYGKNVAVSSRLIVFWSVVFCLVSVLAVVAAGVTGSIAARRGRSLNSWSVFLPASFFRENANADRWISSMSTMRNLDSSLNGNCSSTANGTSGANPSNSQSAQDADPESFISTSDCSDLSSPYIPTLTSMGTTSSNISFDIKCGTDYNEPSADFMTLAAFTFEDCIAACASFNEVCGLGSQPLPIDRSTRLSPAPNSLLKPRSLSQDSDYLLEEEIILT